MDEIYPRVGRRVRYGGLPVIASPSPITAKPRKRPAVTLPPHTATAEPDALVTALRAYALPPSADDDDAGNPAQRRVPQPRPALILALDLETTIDPAQRLTFGSARLWQRCTEGDAHTPAGWRVDMEWIITADDLATTDPAGWETLQTHVAQLSASSEHHIILLSRTAFVNGPFWRVAYKARALIVGFNLPFDLTRLALKWGEGRGRNEGGFSLRFWQHTASSGAVRDCLYRPRIIIKKLASQRALIKFSTPAEVDSVDTIPEGAPNGKSDGKWRFRGHFLDAATLSFALTSEHSSLMSACATWDVEHSKLDVSEHGKITEEYIEYNRRDVLATFELALKLLAEFDRHPVSPDYTGKHKGAKQSKPTLPATKAYSPASIGKAYLHSMGITPILERQPDFAPELLGRCMCGFYGGRCECRIRHTAVPITLLDFLSMYPTVNALMENWRLLTAHRIDAVDATAEVRQLLTLVAEQGAPAILNAAVWQSFCTVVEIIPHGDRLPVRGEYAGQTGSYTIGVNPVHSDTPVHYMLPDLIASVLLTSKVPDVLNAARFVAHGQLRGLRPALLRGEVPINPKRNDFFRSVIEVRKRPNTPARLAYFLKILGSATGYGVFAEINSQELASGTRAAVEVFTGSKDFTAEVIAPETSGDYFFAPLAASITAAARCMLALLERLVVDAGGSFAFCDTDSMAVVSSERGGLIPCQGGPHLLADGRDAIHALSFVELESIRQRFAELNPYDPSMVPGSVLQRVNLNEKGADCEECRNGVAECVAISAKRYCLFHTLSDGTHPVTRHIVKYSAHGLGAYKNPIDHRQGNEVWIIPFWEAVTSHLVDGTPLELPEWRRKMAILPLTVSTPSLIRGCAQYNSAVKPAARILPFSFMLSAQVDTAQMGHPPGVAPNSFHLIGPFESDPKRWEVVQWFNLHPTVYKDKGRNAQPPGQRFRVRTTTSESWVEDDVATVATIGHVLRRYLVHPEVKSLAPDGGICRPRTRGLLRVRPVNVQSIRYIGKETNKLEEREARIASPDDSPILEYVDPHIAVARWRNVRAVLRVMPHAQTATAAGITTRQLRYLLSARHYPRRATEKRLTALAAAHARRIAGASGSNNTVLAGCVTLLRALPRQCGECSTTLNSHQRLHCSNACKCKARRRRKSTSGL